jgi:hypothetical protein
MQSAPLLRITLMGVPESFTAHLMDAVSLRSPAVNPQLLRVLSARMGNARQDGSLRSSPMPLPREFHFQSDMPSMNECDDRYHDEMRL